MGGWQSVCGSIVAMNLELLDTIHTLQGSKTLERNLRSTRDELQEFGSVSLIERTQCPPEPLNLSTTNKE